MTTNKKPIRVLIADDHFMVRMGLRSVLGHEKDISVVGEASDGNETILNYQKLKPDLLIVDLMMPVLRGAKAIAEIRRQDPTAKILAITAFNSRDTVSEAIQNGADGVLLKDASKDELFSAIRAISSGKRVLSREIQGNLEQQPHLPRLSPRQKEVLRLAAKGFNNSEIARMLNVGTDCIKFHMSSIFLHLGVSSRTEAVATAIDLKLLD